MDQGEPKEAVTDTATEDPQETLAERAERLAKAAQAGESLSARAERLAGTKPAATGHKDATGKVTPFVAPQSDEGYLERLATHVLNTAQGFPGMESVEALAASGPQSGAMGTSKTRTGAKVPGPLSFAEAQSRLRGNTSQIDPDVSMGEQIVGGTALASGLGGATLKGMGAAPAILEHAPVVGRVVRAGRTLGRILDHYAPPAAEAVEAAKPAIDPVKALVNAKPSAGPMIEGFQGPMDTLDELIQSGRLEKGPQSVGDLVESTAAKGQRHGTKARFKMIEDMMAKRAGSQSEPPAAQIVGRRFVYPPR